MMEYEKYKLSETAGAEAEGRREREREERGARSGVVCVSAASCKGN